MKKTLSVVLTSAMALSMFSAVAMADTTAPAATATAKKTSADFSDLKGLDAATQAKFDAMISAGIFDGVTDTTFGLKDEMNRAQFAKVAALIMGLDINKDLKTSSFADVSVDDAANGYALPYIEALKTAGVTDGVTDTTFDPAGKVTKEQLATFLVRVLGKDADAKAKTGTDATVSGWAQGYVAEALELKLLSNNTDGTFGGQANATRDLLLTGAYEAKQQYVPAGKVSVTGAKATGVQQVTVSFNKPVDTDKAKLALTNGNTDVATTVKFADDKKSATMTLTDTNLRAGDYTVTMSGLDAATVDKTTATFTAQDEQVQKIDFVSANDTIAQSKNVVLKVKATNQYGENASASAGNYNVISTDFVKMTKANDNSLLLTLNTANETAGVGIVSVTVINNDSHVTATKNFKIGTVPILTKVELGDATYSVGKSLSGTGQKATYALNLYDQYGSLMTYDALNANPTNLTGAGTTPNIPYPSVIWNDYIDSAKVTTTTEDDGNNMPQLKISLVGNVDKTADYKFTVIDQAASATGTVSIGSSKLATKVQIGQPTDGIAAHDQDVYIPVTAYDAQGNQLSVDDLVSTDNVDRIKVAVAGATNPNGASHDQIEVSGEHKGTIHLTNISDAKNGAVSVNVFIATANTQSQDSKTFTVQAARVPDHIKEVTAPALNGLGNGNSAFKYIVYDQYGKQMDESWNVDGNGNFVSSGGDHYSLNVKATTYAADGTTVMPVTVGAVPANTAYVSNDNDPGSSAVAMFNSTGTVYGNGQGTGETANNDFKVFNNTFRFQANNAPAGSKVQFVASLTKNGVEISKLDKTYNVLGNVSGVTPDLTYSVNSVPALWNAIDSGAILTQADYNGADAGGTELTDVYQEQANNSKFAREIKVGAVNASGDKVALPNVITAVTSGNTTVAQVVYDASTSKAYVIGNKAGTTSLSVSYKTVKGEVKTAIVPITVKADALAVDQLKAGNSAENVSLTGATAGDAAANAYEAMDLSVFDNYGVEYNKYDAQKYNYILGVTFAVNNVSAGGSAYVDNYGKITGTAGTTFDVVATSANGKSVTTSIKIDN